MEYKGDDLVADVEDVWKTIVTRFPKMASAYRAANLGVHWTSGVNDLDVKFLEKWRLLRDQLEYIFADSANIMNDTALALCETMNDYVKSDGAAADALKKAKKDLPDDVPEMGETTVPESGRYYASDDYYDPEVPNYGYDGKAPTIADLEELAIQTEDKLWEALCEELGWFDGTIEWLLPRDEAQSEPGWDKYVATIDKVKEVTKYNPVRFASAIGGLESISKEKHPFTNFVQEVTNVSDSLNPDTRWGGEASRSFRENFLNAYEDIRDTQVVVLGTLLGALQGYQLALEDTHKKYAEAMEVAKSAAQDVIDMGQSNADTMDTAALGAAVAIVGALSGGAGAAASFALASQSITIGSTVLNAKGSAVKKIHENLLACLDGLKEKLDELDDELAKDLAADLEKVTNGRHDPDANLDFPRPAFIDDPASF